MRVLQMKVFYGQRNLQFQKPVVTIGIFDGVHRGHRVLLDTLVRRAAESGRESVVITFDPHPRIVLEKSKGSISFLSSMEEKIELLEKAGIDNLVILRFTRSFSRMKACDFVEQLLIGKIDTTHLIIGHDHHFGFRGEGDFKTIKQCSSEMEFTVEQVEGLRSREGIICSSLIRGALSSGDLDNANKWLGYSYSISGKVISGKRLGRKLGFPTANIKPDYNYKLIPSSGVYAVDTLANGLVMKGILSIGTNPTVNSDQGSRSIEVHILGYDEDLYGKNIEVRFRYRLRNEIRFNSLEELIRQMSSDRDIAEQLLT
jgi:riboflavin kinase/FMN adenylyltransferase